MKKYLTIGSELLTEGFNFSRLRATFHCEGRQVDILILFFVSNLSILETSMKLLIHYKNTSYTDWYIIYYNLCARIICLERVNVIVIIQNTEINNNYTNTLNFYFIWSNISSSNVVFYVQG